jgi:hypothetical protein
MQPRLTILAALVIAMCVAPRVAMAKLTQGGSPSRLHLYPPSARFFNHAPAPSDVEIPEVCCVFLCVVTRACPRARQSTHAAHAAAAADAASTTPQKQNQRRSTGAR